MISRIDFSSRSSGCVGDSSPVRAKIAVNPTTVKRIAALFAGTPIKFVDAGIIGGPPQGDYDPVFYASASPEDQRELDEFASLKQWGLNVKTLKGEGAGIGDASALKMSYAVRITLFYLLSYEISLNA